MPRRLPPGSRGLSLLPCKVSRQGSQPRVLGELKGTSPGNDPVLAAPRYRNSPPADSVYCLPGMCLTGNFTPLYVQDVAVWGQARRGLRWPRPSPVLAESRQLASWHACCRSVWSPSMPCMQAGTWSSPRSQSEPTSMLGTITFSHLIFTSSCICQGRGGFPELLPGQVRPPTDHEDGSCHWPDGPVPTTWPLGFGQSWDRWMNEGQGGK